jgi:hypothetical protein
LPFEEFRLNLRLPSVCAVTNNNIGLSNKRSVHGFSAGKEDNIIAADYRSKAKALAEIRFYRVANAVRKLTEGYERDTESKSERDIFNEKEIYPE